MLLQDWQTIHWGGDATNTTNANCLLAGLTYTYSLQAATSPKEMRQNHCKITSEKWIENELKRNWFIIKWMVNWIDSPFFKMNGELNWFTVFWKWMVNWMIHQKLVNGPMSAKIELARFTRKWCKMRHFWRFQTMWILWFLNKHRRTETIKRVYRNGFSLGSRAESKRCREKRRPRGYCIQQDVYPWKILSYRHPSYFYSCIISIFIIKSVRK